MVIVGIDAHKHSHTAVAVDDAGRKLGQHTTGTTSEDHLALLSWAEQGDWEGDLIVGRHSRSAIGTLVDRRSRVVKLIHLPAGHGAEQLRLQPISALGDLPALHRLTLTWDQGSAMAEHDQIAEHFRDGVFSAHPASPWQRGSNENMNGLLRQYFPKGSDLSVHSPADLRAVEVKLNQRPRKTLDWCTPDEVFARDAMIST